jgi:hypothetical protein
LTIGLALSGAADNEVGIITPYNAQSRLLKAMAKDVAVNDPSLKKITCATVHSYQGAEKDIILYDTVDCYRNKYASGLITSKVGDYANRLFNVAVTRAKGKFVLVGNMYFFKSRLTSDLLFYKLYHSYCNSKNIIGCRDLLKNEINKTTKTYSLFDVQNGNDAFINDINNAKKEVAIYIPNYIDEKNCNYLVFVEALKKAKNRGVNVFIIAENWWYLPKELKKFARQEKFVYDPVSIIDRKITWFGEPISKAYFKIEGGRRDPEVRPIIRFLGENTAKVLHRFFRNN